MKELNFEFDFSTPAFLGNSEQVAQLRTPPIKALLRQWWRIAVARSFEYNYSRILERENMLFGKAADGNATRSQLRLRLGNWDLGALAKWEMQEKIKPQGTCFPVEASFYLGFGPLERTKAGTIFGVGKASKKQRTAIPPATQKVSLWIGFPGEYENELQQASNLIQWLGTIGSRSRNGWGSIDLLSGSIPPFSRESLKPFARSWNECLKLEWAHAIGMDEKGVLVWQTTSSPTWKEVMKKLAEIRIQLRSGFPFSGKEIHAEPQEKHVLAYPVTKHALKGFDMSIRIPNQLRFKVLRTVNGFQGIIYHLPCRAPDEIVTKLKNQAKKFQELELAVWPEVHKNLDTQNGLTRLK